MADKPILLTERDYLRIVDLLEERARLVRTTRNRPHVPRELGGSPEVYIARTPPTGIDALSPGTISEVGTGSTADDVPGSAECTVYQLVDDHFYPVSGNDRTVKNLSLLAVPGSSLVLVLRDKYGTWYVPPDYVQDPEVHIALTPGGGIPALVKDLNTGTGTPLGTGRAAGAGNTPGYADCAVYKVVITQGIPDLASTELTYRVYNLSAYDISGGTWIPIAKDKYGSWVACYAGGYTGTREIVVDVVCSGFTLTVTTELWEFLDGRLVGVTL